MKELKPPLWTALDQLIQEANNIENTAGTAKRITTHQKAWLILQIATHDAQPIPDTKKEGVTIDHIIKIFGNPRDAKNPKRKIKEAIRSLEIRMKGHLTSKGNWVYISDQAKNLIQVGANLPFKYHFQDYEADATGAGLFQPQIQASQFNKSSSIVAKALLKLEGLRNYRNKKHSTQDILKESAPLTEDQVRKQLTRAIGWISYKPGDKWKLRKEAYTELYGRYGLVKGKRGKSGKKGPKQIKKPDL